MNLKVFNFKEKLHNDIVYIDKIVLQIDQPAGLFAV